MEGKTSACAHLSPMGNLAAAACDTWSNESVQNIKLLGGMAPTCYMEQLIYDCRLMNRASAAGREAALQFQRYLVESDESYDPQAYILSPRCCVEIARAIVKSSSHYHAGIAAGRTACELLREAHGAGRLKIAANEVSWLDTLQDTLEDLPADEHVFIGRQLAAADRSKFLPAEYDLAGY
jgi:methanol--5-hydroxybenzimidazolylcobamide Co-methyltransferase